MTVVRKADEMDCVKVDCSVDSMDYKSAVGMVYELVVEMACRMVV